MLFLNLTHYTTLQLSLDLLQSVLPYTLIVAKIAMKLSVAVLHSEVDILAKINVII